MEKEKFERAQEIDFTIIRLNKFITATEELLRSAHNNGAIRIVEGKNDMGCVLLREDGDNELAIIVCETILSYFKKKKEAAEKEFEEL